MQQLILIGVHFKRGVSGGATLRSGRVATKALLESVNVQREACRGLQYFPIQEKAPRILRFSGRRGNLNQACIYLKEKEKFRLTIFVEYYLEYQATGFEPRIPIC